jgi:hypothetical protein
MSAFYRINVGDTPMPSDVNQLADALSGDADVGAITFAPAINDPSTAIGVATATAGTSLGVGAYLYAVTFVTGILKDDATVVVSGETLPSPTKSVTTTSGNQATTLTSIPNSADTTVVAKRVYRTAVGGAQLKLVATIPAGQTSYTDTTADADLGSNAPTSNTTGTYIDGVRIINVPTPSASGDAANKAFVEDTRIGRGTSNQSVETHIGLVEYVGTLSVTYGYTSGRVSTVTWKDGTTTVRTASFTYNGSGVLTTVVETFDGTTVTTTYAYNTDGTVSGETRVVS